MTRLSWQIEQDFQRGTQNSRDGLSRIKGTDRILKNILDLTTKCLAVCFTVYTCVRCLSLNSTPRRSLVDPSRLTVSLRWICYSPTPPRALGYCLYKDLTTRRLRLARAIGACAKKEGWCRNAYLGFAPAAAVRSLIDFLCSQTPYLMLLLQGTHGYRSSLARRLRKFASWREVATFW